MLRAFGIVNALDQILAQPRNRRVLLGGMGAAAFILALAIGALALLSPPDALAFQGTTLDPPKETLPFTLVDQDGRTVQWEDYRGRPVILTFLYTSCRDVCPMVAAKLDQTFELLGDDAARVALVAITVDPERDTPEQIREFSEAWNMAGRWDYLVGAVEELEPLWEAYWVGEVRQEAVGADPAPARRAPGAYLVEHTSPVHLVDGEGWGRTAYSSAFLSGELAHDVRLLLRSD